MTEINDIQLSEAEEKDNVNAESTGVTAAAAEAEIKENTAAAELGKFKSVDALLKAYSSLEAEFTRRSKRLKELEEGNKAQSVPPAGAPSPESKISREELLKAALSDEEIKSAVVENYLKGVAENKSIPLILGGVSTPAPKSAPKSVREAGRLAEQFLKN